MQADRPQLAPIVFGRVRHRPAPRRRAPAAGGAGAAAAAAIGNPPSRFTRKRPEKCERWRKVAIKGA